jgi:hypothetical protein
MRTRKAISRRTIPIGAILAMAGATLVLTATPALAASVTNGFNGGGDTVTVAGTSLDTATLYLVQFQTASCASSGLPSYTTGVIGTVATAADATTLPVKVPAAVKVTTGRFTLYNLCIWDLADTSNPLATYTATTYTANIFDLVLDANMDTGPNGGGNTITATVRAPSGSSAVTVIPPSAGYPIQFQPTPAPSASCALTYSTANGPTVTASNPTTSVGSGLSMTVPTAGALPANIPNVTATAPSADYNLCVYSGTSATSALIAGTDNGVLKPYTVNVYSLTPLTPASGPAGGGNTIVATVTKGRLTTLATYYTQFQKSSACTDTVIATGGVGDATATATAPTTLSIPVPAGVTGAPSDTYKVCVYSASTVGSKLLAQSLAQYTLAAYGLSLSNYAVGAGTLNGTVTATMNGGALPLTPAVEFLASSSGTCLGTYQTPGSGVAPYAAATVSQVSSTKVAITVPDAVTAATASFAVCIYSSTNTTSGLLIAGTALPYVVASAVAIGSVDVSAGPAQGGTAIKVFGTFPTSGLTASIAGQALTITALTTTYFTATVPAHAAGIFPITVTTAAGTIINPTVTFTYSNGINVTPQTAPSMPVQTVIDVRGVGFSSLDFSETGGILQNGSGAHVYLVKGSYSPTALTSTPTGKTNGQIAECVSVRVVSDTELVCSFYLGGRPAGYTRTVTGCGFTAATAVTTCAITASDVGLYVTATGTGSGAVPDGTTITGGTGTTATLSRAATGVLTAASVTLSTARDVTVSGNFSVSGVTLTSTSTTTPVFTSADLGKVVSVTGSGAAVPAGTTITGVTTAGVVTLSNAVTGTATAVHLYSPTYNGATTGTYTITVVSSGAVAPTTYTASIISSGSTFTVADYRRR